MNSYERPPEISDNLWDLFQYTDFDDEEREDWIIVMRNMTKEQLVRFEKILERNKELNLQANPPSND